MNKTDILTRLRDWGFDKAQYWVITGSAMVLYGIREETGDIDMGCTSLLADQLEKTGYQTERIPDGSRKIVIGSDVGDF